ncbi:hypothetical protein K466DRAFT_581877 [Polyporus arcularius HHB13444]|uniref:Uncharacterized protein n=1 Tax=Polyporus arcularius HHB13444 TaxID=1314778 RepID=A0A5C3PVG5_9APHY|nr:hypothetical protein K466DRAFT_581877 [Polyporus arcularius HHB13444]
MTQEASEVRTPDCMYTVRRGPIVMQPAVELPTIEVYSYVRVMFLGRSRGLYEEGFYAMCAPTSPGTDIAAT